MVLSNDDIERAMLKHEIDALRRLLFDVKVRMETVEALLDFRGEQTERLVKKAKAPSKRAKKKRGK